MPRLTGSSGNWQLATGNRQSRVTDEGRRLVVTAGRVEEEHAAFERVEPEQQSENLHLIY